MFTLFQIFYLMMYFATLFGFFSLSLNKIKQLEYERLDMTSVNKYLQLLDEYLFFDLIENIENFYDLNKDMDNIIVYVDNTEVSKCQMLVLNDMFPESNKIAICLEQSDDFDILKLSEELDFKYYNKYNEFSEGDENEREFMINYCKLCDIKYCFMNLDNNELISVIFDGFFNNDYSSDINEIEQSEEDCIFIYNIFANPKIFLSYVNLWDHFFGNTNNNYTDSYYYHQDLINDNWRTNMYLTYNQLKREDFDLSNKIKNLYNHNEFKYGVIIYLDNDNLPYWLWENMFSQYCDNFNLTVEKQVIQTLYFTITQNKKDNGEILLDWRYNYNNNIFILYNYTGLQNMLDNCDRVELGTFEVNNNIESFLDGNIIYEVLEDSENEFLTFNDINLNLENTNNEDIFSNFNFKKLPIDSIVKNSV